MEELTKLWQYLITHKYFCEWKYDELDGRIIRNQIIIYSDEQHIDRLWDAICHEGSFGYAQGLLEIYGIIVYPMIDGDGVIGYLTADEIINKYIPRLK